MSEKQLTILHVEDDEVDAMVMQRALKKTTQNFTLHHAKNGLQALQMLRGEGGYEALNPRPNIIMLDLNMPQMNGHEFLTELRSDPALKPIAVYVLSTSNDDRDRVLAYEKNVAGYLLKPLDLEAYISKISILNSYWQLIEMP
jgi:CheY-like chemotaxis protein